MAEQLIEAINRALNEGDAAITAGTMLAADEAVDALLAEIDALLAERDALREAVVAYLAALDTEGIADADALRLVARSAKNADTRGGEPR